MSGRGTPTAPSHATTPQIPPAPPQPPGRTSLRSIATVPLPMAGILGYLALSSGNRWLLVLPCAVFGLFCATLVFRPRLDGLVVAQEIRQRVAVGDACPTIVRIHNAGRTPSSPARVELCTPGFSLDAVDVPALPPGSTTTVALDRTAVERAAADGHYVLLHSSAPFGLLQVLRPVLVSGRLIVHPRRVQLSPSPPAQRSARRGGADLHGLREWRPGDVAKDLSRRASARHGRPVVVEREEPLRTRLGIVVLGPAGAPGWERLVSRVAATATAGLRDHTAVALMARQRGLPSLVSRSPELLLDWCALLAQPEHPEPEQLAEAIRWVSSGQSGGDLVLATCLPPAGGWADALRAGALKAGVRVTVLRPDRTDEQP